MRKIISRFFISITLLAVASTAYAVPISLDFEGQIIGGTIDPDFAPLLSGGDLLSGSVQFDFSPPSNSTVTATLGGSYTVPSGTVSGYVNVGTGSGASTASFTFGGGSGPSTTSGGDTFTLEGFFISFAIDGFNAPLVDYLALDASDVQILKIRGRTDFATGGTAGVFIADVEATAVSFRLLSVPEPSTLGLLGAGLLGLFMRRKRVA